MERYWTLIVVASLIGGVALGVRLSVDRRGRDSPWEIPPRRMILAGTRQIPDAGRDVEMAYSHKLRETHVAAIAWIRADLERFLADVVTRKAYGSTDGSVFEQRYTELLCEVHDHADELNQLTVPSGIRAAHWKISHSHNSYCAMLGLLRRGFYASREERIRLYAESRHMLASAEKEDLDGEAAALEAFRKRVI